MKNRKRFLGALLGSIVSAFGVSVCLFFFSDKNLMEEPTTFLKIKASTPYIGLGLLFNVPVFISLLRKEKFELTQGLLIFLLVFMGIIAIFKVG